MSRILIIRSLIEAFPLSEMLTIKGQDPICYPLFEPHFYSLSFIRKPQAFIITSKNALRAIEAREDLKKTQLYVVGDQTAKLAQSMGFSKVKSASGTSQELRELIFSQAHPEKGILYHLSGESITGDLIKELQEKGFLAERRVVYHIKNPEQLPERLITDLLYHTISHIMFFSPRTTMVFAALLKKCKLEKKTNMLTALCLSKNVARTAQDLRWREIWISPRPTLQNMLRYFDEKK